MRYRDTHHMENKNQLLAGPPSSVLASWAWVDGSRLSRGKYTYISLFWFFPLPKVQLNDVHVLLNLLVHVSPTKLSNGNRNSSLLLAFSKVVFEPNPTEFRNNRMCDPIFFSFFFLFNKESGVTGNQTT